MQFAFYRISKVIIINFQKYVDQFQFSLIWFSLLNELSKLRQKYDDLQQENQTLKDENLKYKTLYDDRLDELKWYYRKFGRRNPDQTDYITFGTGNSNQFSSQVEIKL